MLFLLHISTRGPYFYIYNSAELWFLTLKFSKDSCDIRREKKQKKQPTTPTFILLSHSIIFLPCLWVSSRSNLNWFPMHRRAIIRQQETASLFPPLGFFWGKKKKKVCPYILELFKWYFIYDIYDYSHYAVTSNLLSKKKVQQLSSRILKPALLKLYCKLEHSWGKEIQHV